MIIKTSVLKNLCTNIQNASDNESINGNAKLLNLVNDGTNFTVNYQTDDYAVQSKIASTDTTDFDVTVDLSKFCKLVSCLTSDDVELIKSDKTLVVKAGQGKYDIELLQYPEATFDVTPFTTVPVIDNFELSKENLNSILKCNLRETEKRGYKKTIHGYVYLDSDGAISFNVFGACVNKFTTTITNPVFFNKRVIKLFKLFDGDVVKCSTCSEQVTSEMNRLDLKMSDDTTTVYAYLVNNDKNLPLIPVANIRGMADKNFGNDVQFSKSSLLSIINIFSILDEKTNAILNCTFTPDFVEVFNKKGTVKDKIYYSSGNVSVQSYETSFYVDDIKKTLDGYEDDNVLFKFGDARSCTLTNRNITTIVSEVKAN